MTPTLDQLKQHLSQLSSQDRAELAHFLILSLDEDPDQELEAAWDIEISRRLAEIESGQVRGIPADQVFRDLRQKYQ